MDRREGGGIEREERRVSGGSRRGLTELGTTIRSGTLHSKGRPDVRGLTSCIARAKGGRHHHFQARPRRSYYDDPKRLKLPRSNGIGCSALGMVALSSKRTHSVQYRCEGDV